MTVGLWLGGHRGITAVCRGGGRYSTERLLKRVSTTPDGNVQRGKRLTKRNQIKAQISDPLTFIRARVHVQHAPNSAGLPPPLPFHPCLGHHHDDEVTGQPQLEAFFSLICAFSAASRGVNVRICTHPPTPHPQVSTPVSQLSPVSFLIHASLL